MEHVHSAEGDPLLLADAHRLSQFFVEVSHFRLREKQRRINDSGCVSRPDYKEPETV